MQTFRKALSASVIYVAVVLVISLAWLIPFLSSEYYRTNDLKDREKLAGKIDTVIIGASNGMDGFDTRTLDDLLGCSSYNLCGPTMTWSGRKAMLDEELSRNNIKTVFIEFALESFEKDTYVAESAVYLVPRLSDANKVNYMLRNFDLETTEQTFGVWMNDAINYWGSVMLGKNSFFGTLESKKVAADYKGFRSSESSDLSLNEDEIIGAYRSKNIADKVKDTNEDNLKIIREIIDELNVKGINVTIVTLPYADFYVWEYYDWEIFAEKTAELKASLGCAYYDFNLLKDRYSLLDDSDSFVDGAHLSEKGAEAFTAAFCDVIKKVNAGEDVSDLFYDSYEEMKQDSPYMEYYLAHKDD